MMTATEQPPAGRDSVRSESGLASILIVGFVFTVFATAGLVVDGSRILGSTRECELVAGSAARVGAQKFSDTPAADGDIVLDPVEAKAAAEDVLREEGYSVFRVDATETTVRVKVWKEIPMVMWLAWKHNRVGGSAAAQLRSGIEK